MYKYDPCPAHILDRFSGRCTLLVRAANFIRKAQNPNMRQTVKIWHIPGILDAITMGQNVLTVE
jgi:hypothetical protein